MTESLHQPDDESNVVPIESGAIDPSELERSDVLRQFLTQCTHPSLKAGRDLSDFIIAALHAAPSDEWSSHIQQLKVESQLLDPDMFEQIQQDEVFGRIIAMIRESMAKAGRDENSVAMRLALRELMSLRAGIMSQFDRAALTDESNESHWTYVLDKLKISS